MPDSVLCACVLGKGILMKFPSLQRPPPVLDALGRVISESPPDQWEARYSYLHFYLLTSCASKCSVPGFYLYIQAVVYAYISIRECSRTKCTLY